MKRTNIVGCRGSSILAALALSCTLPVTAQQVWFSFQEGDLRRGDDSSTVNTSGTLVSSTYTTDCTFIRGYISKDLNMNSQTELRMGTTADGVAGDFDNLRLLAGFDLTPLADYVAGNAYSINAVNIILTHKALGAGGNSGMALLNTTPFDETTATWNNPGSGAPAGGTLGTQITTKTIAGNTLAYPTTQVWTHANLIPAIQTALANPTNKQAAFLFKRGTESDAGINTSYVTDENTDVNFGGVDARPELQISITILSNAPLVSVSAPDNTASEAGLETGMFTISRTGPATNDLTVYFTLTGSATANVDYTLDPPVFDSIVLPTGVNSTNILLQPIDDSTIEDHESATLRIVADPSDSANYGISVASATVTIADDNDANALVDYMFGNSAAARVWSDNLTASTAVFPGLNVGYSATAGLHLSPPSGLWIQGSSTAADESGAISGNDYIGFTVAPKPGYTLALTNLEISGIYYNPDQVATGAVMFLRSSLDNYATTLGSVTLLPEFPDFPGFVKLNVPLGAEFTGIGAQVQFRIYVYDDATTTQSGLRVDNLILAGTTETLPEGQYQVEISASNPNAAEPNVAGEFTITRYGSTANPLTVFYNVTGTATAGVDYTALPGSVEIPSGASSVTIPVSPIDDLVSEGSETVIVTIQANAAYHILAANSATVNIVDDAEPLQVSLAATDSIAYERDTNLFAYFTVSRTAGDTPATVNFALGGTALPGVDYLSSATNSIAFGVGETQKTVIIYPIPDEVPEPVKTVVMTLLPGDYHVPGQTNRTAFIYDDDLPTEEILFADSLNTADSATNYTILEAARDGVPDSSVTFAYDYSVDNVPPAPGSTDTIGLKLSANKTGSASSAAVNLFSSMSFSNNFALRFSVYLQWLPSANFAEHALAGIGQSGSVINWRNQSGTPQFVSGDGFWAGMVNNDQDGSYSLYHQTAAASAPVTISTTLRTAMTSVFNNPPFGAPGGLPGTFGCADVSTTKTWVDCELSQVENIIIFKINGWPVTTYIDPEGPIGGKIMIGFMDAFDSLGPIGNFAIFDNVRVVRLPALSQPVITDISSEAGTITIQFTGAGNDTTASFKLQSAASVNGVFADDDAAILSGSGGAFQAVTSANGAQHFYRIRRTGL